MLLQLGRHPFDISTRAVVMATVHTDDSTVASARELVDAGAQIIELQSNDIDRAARAVADLTTALDVPIAISSSDVLAIDAAFDAGAIMAVDRSGFADPMYLFTIAEAAGSAAINDPTRSVSELLERARWAVAAGLSPSQIVIDASHLPIAEVASAGFPVMVRFHADPTAQGAHVAAMMAGARILVCNDVRATKRTADTVSELLERRGVAAPDAVAVGSS